MPAHGRYIIDGEKVGSGFAKPASNTTAVFAGIKRHLDSSSALAFGIAIFPATRLSKKDGYSTPLFCR
jgi:hypothetical protein